MVPGQASPHENFQAALVDAGDSDDDPFLSRTRDLLTEETAGGPLVEDEVARLKQLAGEVNDGMSADPGELGPRSLQWLRVMDPRWLGRWLTVDPDHPEEAAPGVDVGMPRGPTGVCTSTRR
jgi:hypothetical protein